MVFVWFCALAFPCSGVPALWRSSVPPFQHSSVMVCRVLAFPHSGVRAFVRSGGPAFQGWGALAFQRFWMVLQHLVFFVDNRWICSARMPEHHKVGILEHRNVGTPESRAELHRFGYVFPRSCPVLVLNAVRAVEKLSEVQMHKGPLWCLSCIAILTIPPSSRTSKSKISFPQSCIGVSVARPAYIWLVQLVQIFKHIPQSRSLQGPNYFVGKEILGDALPIGTRLRERYKYAVCLFR